MTTEISWLIEGMQCKPQDGDLANVVITAFWRCNGVNGDFSATVYGSCGFQVPGDPFTPYEDLTQEQVLGWCWDGSVDKEAIEANIEQQIQTQIDPPVVNLPLPWNN